MNNDLFHYCSNESLISILNSKSIRLSSLHFSNDSAEGKLLEIIISNIAKARGCSEAEIKHLDILNRIYTDGFDGYAFCLSAREDRLNQWVSYANVGAGVSIGFSSKRLQDYVQKTMPSVKFVRISYKTSEQEALVDAIFDKILQLLVNSIRTSLPNPIPSFEDAIKSTDKSIKELVYSLMNVSEQILERIFSIKNDAFHEEEEYRLVLIVLKGIISKNDLQFSIRKDQIVPYHSFAIPPEESLISKIVLGPKNPTPIHVVEQLLLNAGYENIKVTKSNITYQ